MIFLICSLLTFCWKFIKGDYKAKPKAMRPDDDEELQEKNESPYQHANLLSKLVFW